MSQLVLGDSVLGASKSKFAHSLLIPAACAAVSIVLFLVHLIFTAGPVKRYIAKLRDRTIAEDGNASSQPIVRQHSGFFPELHWHIKGHGGGVVFAWKVLRLLACMTLTALTIVAIISITEGHKTIGVNDVESDVDAQSKWGKKHKKHKKKRARWFSTTEWIEISLCLFYTYATLLAIFALALRPRLRAVANFHLVALLLAAFSVYIWRDLLPFATFELHPADAAGGWLTWSRIGVLAFASVVVPLCIPRPYIPLDPSNPSTPNPEQTASLISLLLYNFLDPIIWTAYRSPKLEYDQLPPLADYDHAAHLKYRSFDKLDPLRHTKDRHLFWGLMEVFWKEYCVMAVMITIQALMEFAGPVGIRYLLLYLQNPAEPGFIRPWVWILWLFLGPVLGSIAMQLYIFTTTGSLVRTEGMLTQLLFEHSLRIRMVAEVVSSGGKTPKTGTRAGTPSVAGSERTAVEGEARTSEEGEADSTGHTAEGSNGQTLVASTSSVKGKNKKDESKDKEDDSDSSNLVGKINNLMSTDLGNIIGGRDFLFVILYAPVQIIVSIWLLYNILGWSAVIGMVVMLLTFPIPGKVAQLVNNVQVERMKKTDARVQTVTESMNVIRMIKLFGWEKKVKAQVEEKREEELYWYKKTQFLQLFNMNLNYVLPLIVMLVTFASHTLLFKRPLDASTVFSSIGVFDVLRAQLWVFLRQIPKTIQAKVSLDRTNEFLNNTELLDAYTEKNAPVIIEPNPPIPGAIGFRNATFTWTRQIPGTPTPSRRNFRLCINEEVLFRRGKINMVVGPTGCGKTSLLMALLGEMHFVSSAPDSWFSLPREGGVAYAAQEAWVQNETIQENILFGTEYDEERYNKVITQCALERDLTLFDAGDQTEVGEKGMTLSGGQKARVSLARAIYSNADIIILDDVLSALDVHTSRWIVDHCFRGDLVAGRTMIIVTHNVAMVSEVADFVISLGTDGRIVSQGSVDDAFRSNPKLKAEAEKDQELERKGEQVVDNGNPTGDKIKEPQAKKSDGKLMVAEEVAEGHVGWAALKLFLLALGGAGFWLMYAVGFILSDVAVLLQTYWLGIWARAYNDNADHPERVDVPFYLAVYGVVCVLGMVLFIGAFVIHVFGSIRASRRIHDRLIESVLGASLRWLDSTPIGRVIARFTQDIRCVDGSLPNEMQNLVDMTIQLLSRFIAIIVFSPIFTLPGAVVFILGIWIGQIYIAAQLSVKREMSNARSPLFSHFGAALQGITSIRAYGAQDQFKNEALKRIDKYTRAARTFYNLNRWICIRMDALGGMFAAGLAAYLVYNNSRTVDASDTGFSLSMAVAFSGSILWWIRILNDFEVQGNSLERIQDYVQIEQEPEAVPEKVPPAYWPASGNIVVENLTARYSKDGPAVLHSISFKIKSGERVGVVGRTGSGKSSLTLSLLRMIPIEGNIYYDGIPTHAINLDALRSNITIIPQQPELMSGTVRQNLDPFDEHDDATLNAALRSAGLDTVQSEDDEGYIGLESGVSAGGGNFSLGQRQILALARAIVRRSKVLILDEATAAIDYNTDTAIQRSIRTELNDLTLIIVAHRLQTICDADKIMVLEAGKIIEFDSPAALLRKEGGAFKSLVDESGDRDALYAMAKGQ